MTKVAKELLQPALPQIVCDKPLCDVFFFLKTTFFREGSKGQGREGGLFCREDAKRAALLSSSASLCAVESQVGFYPPPWSPQDMIPERCAGGMCIDRSRG